MACARIKPRPLEHGSGITDLVDNAFQAYNAARLREAAQLLTAKILREKVTVGLSLSGALTPAGLGASCIVPLIKNGFVDWIASTGANLYHDAHFALDFELHRGSPFVSDVDLRAQGIIRIYDVLFDYRVLLDTDASLRSIGRAPEFENTMSSATLHYLLGKYLAVLDKNGTRADSSVLITAYNYGVPIFTPSPGDSSIGMNLAGLALEGRSVQLDISADINESAALVYETKRSGGRSAVIILGGGAPKNFMLQTEPHIQEVLGLPEKGHDYFIQITDARPDSGGLSGATPMEAVSWGKIDPAQLPDTVVCYADTTIALPLLTVYALSKAAPRSHKRLYGRREELVAQLKRDYLRHKKSQR